MYDVQLHFTYYGALGHNSEGNSVAFQETVKQAGWNIVFETQPAQSPDCNKKDLLLFQQLAVPG